MQADLAAAPEASGGPRNRRWQAPGNSGPHPLLSALLSAGVPLACRPWPRPSPPAPAPRSRPSSCRAGRPRPWAPPSSRAPAVSASYGPPTDRAPATPVSMPACSWLPTYLHLGLRYHLPLPCPSALPPRPRSLLVQGILLCWRLLPGKLRRRLCCLLCHCQRVRRW